MSGTSFVPVAGFTRPVPTVEDKVSLSLIRVKAWVGQIVQSNAPSSGPSPRAMPAIPPSLWRLARGAVVLPLAALLSGCDWVVLNPSGDIARQQAHLVIVATALMLLLIVPVRVLTPAFAWRYRSSNTAATYAPDWHHSTKLELVIWSAPLMIIIALGSITWVTTHTLDPYRPLSRIDAARPLPAGTKPLEVQVVALDWKWLFIYPEQKIATVNDLVLPVDRPVQFRLTASSVMNSFYVPALAGQIYAMPGMETKLHAVLNRTGAFQGFSAQYSGAGFSKMRFVTRGVSAGDFDAWAAGIRKGADALDRTAYLKLEQPSEKEPVRHFASVDPALFDAAVNLCVRPGKMCVNQMMAIDAEGGTGRAGQFNLAALTYDKFGREKVVPVLPGRQPSGAQLFVNANVYCAGKGPLKEAPPQQPASLSLAAPASSPVS